MSTRKRTAETVVRLNPVPGAYINGEPSAMREVSEEEAERLLAYYPPAYVVAPEKPKALEAPQEPVASVDEDKE